MRWISSAVLFALAISFTFGVVFYAAPLTVTAVSFEGLYKDSESIYGIVWDESMSDLRVDLFNPADRDYDHLDVTIVTADVFIRDQKQISNVPGVSFLPLVHQIHQISRDNNGNATGEKNISISSYNSLRLLCDRLPKKTTIGLILAVSDRSSEIKKAFGPLRNGIYGIFNKPPAPFAVWVRKRASTIRVFGDYSVLNRPHKLDRMYSAKQE